MTGSQEALPGAYHFLHRGHGGPQRLHDCGKSVRDCLDTSLENVQGTRFKTQAVHGAASAGIPPRAALPGKKGKDSKAVASRLRSQERLVEFHGVLSEMFSVLRIHSKRLPPSPRTPPTCSRERFIR